MKVGVGGRTHALEDLWPVVEVEVGKEVVLAVLLARAIPLLGQRDVLGLEDSVQDTTKVMSEVDGDSTSEQRTGRAGTCTECQAP